MASPWQGNVADWLRTGSGLFAQAAQRCTEADFAGASLLPGWSRSHVVSHVSANAQAIGRLLHWARTGEPLPMYPSMQERDREIAEGAQLPMDELISWYTTSNDALQCSFATLPDDAWSYQVLTAQGREVPAVETLWMRSREVCIHAVDLDMDIGFAQLPEDFLVRLAHEAAARHNGNSSTKLAISITTDDGRYLWKIDSADGDHGDSAVDITGPLADIASWLVGRGAGSTYCADGAPVPDLPKWL
jgi:uncharacterized protein (TIGR03083 family)